MRCNVTHVLALLKKRTREVFLVFRQSVIVLESFFPAYGRADMMLVCARRIFATATIFIAEVILAMFFTEPMRVRISRSVAIF